jgi:stage V sporulation protein B
MEVFHLHIYAVIIANAFYALMMCFLNQSAVLKFSGASIDIRKVVLAPLEASCIMGVIAYLMYHMFDALFVMAVSRRAANLFACVIAILFAVVVYFLALFMFKGVDEETLLKFPGGSKLCNIAYSLHLLR